MATFVVNIRDSNDKERKVIPGVTFNPATLNIVDIDVRASQVYPAFTHYDGYLKEKVVATFPNGRTIEFPKSTIVDALEKPDGSISTVTLLTNDDYTPVVLPLRPDQAGGRRHRRSTRARKTNRRHRRRVSRRRA
jgi:hypothetical protein